MQGCEPVFIRYGNGRTLRLPPRFLTPYMARSAWSNKLVASVAGKGKVEIPMLHPTCTSTSSIGIGWLSKSRILWATLSSPFSYVSSPLQQTAKFVAAETGHQVAFAASFQQAGANNSQYFVAGKMAKGVID